MKILELVKSLFSSDSNNIKFVEPVIDSSSLDKIDLESILKEPILPEEPILLEEPIIHEVPNIKEDVCLTINKDELLANTSENMMITVGLDFGTHQTKICVEGNEGVEIKYTFVKFEATDHKMYFTIPSIIGIGKNKLLQYGYLPNDFDGEIIRYFKQEVFNITSTNNAVSNKMAMYYSIWYIAYILFELEDVYGQNFAIQMGVPTGSSHLTKAKEIATRIILSSYKLVEIIYENDKSKFLSDDLNTLISKTEIVRYSKKKKDELGILVFPEAYACLKPLTSQQKIEGGMSLMIDIGGGTTDISFFSIENGAPQVFDFCSLNKGLNYLTCAEQNELVGIDSNVKKSAWIEKDRLKLYRSEIINFCIDIKNKLVFEFKRQTFLSTDKLLKALDNRPLVYCGGGSTFDILRKPYEGFKDIKQVSESEWNTQSVTQIQEIASKKLCPILSTAYGLAISTTNDDIQTKPFRDIFDNMRGAVEEPSNSNSEKRWHTFGEGTNGYNFENRDAWNN